MRVLDLYSRLVVGWSMSNTMTVQLVTDALVMAIWRRGRPETLLHHPIRAASTRVRRSSDCYLSPDEFENATSSA